jgi:hypothetical protein
VAIIIILILIIVACLFKFFRHWWQGDTFGEVGQWIDETSLLFGVMVERTSFTELAVTILGPELAWNGLVVGVDSTQGSLAEVLW